MTTTQNTIIPAIKSTRAKVHYVNNADFLAALIKYKEHIKKNAEEGKEPPRIPDYIGECIYNIAKRLSHKFNFVNYSYREEMVSDGIENCLIYLNNFDPAKSSNPFAYFTQIIYFAFLRRIQREKKQLYIKHKVLERDIIHMSIVDQQTGDSSEFTPTVKIDGDFIDSFVTDFENKLLSKKKAPKMSIKPEEI